MNNVSDSAYLHSVLEHIDEAVSALTGRSSRQLAGSYEELLLEHKPLSKALARIARSARPGVPLLVGNLLGPRTVEALIVPDPATAQFELRGAEESPENARRRALIAQVTALGDHLTREVEAARALLRDAQRGVDILERLAELRRPGALRAVRLELLRLWRDTDLLALNETLTVGGLLSAPQSVSFLQRLSHATVLHEQGTDRLVVDGVWSGTVGCAKERNMNRVRRVHIGVRVARERDRVTLTLARLTKQSLTLVIRTDWPLGPGRDRYEVVQVMPDARFRNDVESWLSRWLAKYPGGRTAQQCLQQSLALGDLVASENPDEPFGD